VFAGSRAKRDGPVAQVKLGYVYVGRSAGRFSRRRGGLGARLLSNRGEIPDSVAIAQQINLRLINAKVGDVELLAENQRHQFNAHLQRFRLDKRSVAELGIVGDGELVGFHAAGENAEA
jgi:hypothetical protein